METAMAAENHGTILIGGHGTQHCGDWCIEGGNMTVTVRGKTPRKTASISGSAHMPDALARLLLGELIDEECKNPSSA
jgi:hypothetical protein